MALSKEEMGLRIKEARKIKSEKIGKRYTGQMLADDLNISRSYLGDLESGRTYPNYEMLTNIADACEVSLSFFDKIKNEDIEKLAHKEIHSVEDALEIIESQEGLMLKGEALTDEDKLLLANALQLGMKYVLEKKKNKQ